MPEAEGASSDLLPGKYEGARLDCRSSSWRELSPSSVNVLCQFLNSIKFSWWGKCPLDTHKKSPADSPFHTLVSNVILRLSVRWARNAMANINEP
jgi:hypothetical protein